MEKQLEWAAAISSSGLVLPLASCARDAHVTGCWPMPEESKVTTPLPSSRLPSHTVCAVRVVATMIPFDGVPFSGSVRTIRSHLRATHPE